MQIMCIHNNSIQYWKSNSLLNQCLTIKLYNLISNQTYTLNNENTNKENHNDMINGEIGNKLIPIMISD